MSASQAVAAIVATQPSVASSQTPKTAKKQSKKVAKPAAVKKTTTPKKSSSHPKFLDMIVEAIKSLNERSGSSKQALSKYILSKYPVDSKNANQYIKTSLKNALKSGHLKQVSGVGLSGSFKLGDKTKEATKKPKTAVAKKPKEVAAKSTTKSAKPKSEKSKKKTTKAQKPKKTVKKTVKKVAPSQPAAAAAAPGSDAGWPTRPICTRTFRYSGSCRWVRRDSAPGCRRSGR